LGIDEIRQARNNVAYNNLCNRVFPYAKFQQVTKSKPSGGTYPGLRIEVDGHFEETEED
jgi:hypothetical protein